MRKLLSLILIVSLWFSIGFSQQKEPAVSGFLKTIKLGGVKTNYEFTPEWQYVSSDLYLFNTEKFADVINSIITGKKMRWWRRKRYDLQNILITLQTQGLGQYDNITFPLFNFVLEHDPEVGYKITAESNDVIRIVDNYPAPAIEDFISAKVDVKVVTKDNQIKIYKLAASQLETISLIVTNPSSAVMKIVGEFGKMIQAVADGKEFHFTSTIRIYENDNFNQRLHSIVVFAFVPSSENEAKIDLDLSELQKLLQSDTNITVDRKFLYQHIKLKKYPYIVIVNYKSKYIPEVPEDIDFETLKARESKLASDYKRGVIRNEIYELEKELLEYLKLYAQLQLDLNNYLLNLQNKTTEDFSKFYFLLFRDFWQMKNMYKNITTLRKNNQIFQNDFKKYYDKFLTKAALSLEQNIELQKIKDLANLIYVFETKPMTQVPQDSATVEEYLKILNSVEFPSSEQNTPEAQLVTKWRNYWEQNFFDRYFRTRINTINSLSVNEANYNKILQWQLEYGKTNCKICRQKLNQATKVFIEKYQNYRLAKAKEQFDSLRNQLKIKLIKLTKTLSCIQENLNQAPESEYIRLLKQDALRLDQQRQSLLASINQNYVLTSEQEIDKNKKQLQEQWEQLNSSLQTLCQQEPEICKCEKTEPKQPQTQTDTTQNQQAQKTEPQPKAQAEAKNK